MNNISAENNDLILSNGKRVSFAFPIAEFIEFDSATVVRLNVPTEIIFNENVFGVSSEGDILWQISKRKYVYENSPYMNLSKTDDFVRAHNWDCLDMVLSPKTGAVVKKVQSK